MVTAKQLIRMLEEKVAEHGDLPVLVSAGEWDRAVCDVEHESWTSHRLVEDPRAGAIVIEVE